MSSKMGRRDALKIMAAVGAAIAATPYISSVSALTKNSGLQALAAQSRQVGIEGDDTMVIVVKGSQAFGYTGNQEIKIEDRSLMNNIRDSIGAGRIE